MSKNASLITDANVTVISGGRTAIVSRQFAEGCGIIDALKRGHYAAALNLCDRGAAVASASAGEFTVESGVVLRNGIPVHNVITDRILDFLDKGLPFEPLLVFLNNLHSNPSSRAVTELYSFLEHRNLPVTPDGCFLAYKSVRSDFYSKASGRLTLLSGKTDEHGHIFNGVGEKIVAVRNEIDDDKDRTCSHGLHVGALAYAGPGGWYNSANDKVVIVKVNPADAVSVPADHNAQKLRVCAYEVVAEFVTAFNEPLAAVGASAESKPSWYRERGPGGRFLPK